jgi:hypothetical protein
VPLQRDLEQFQEKWEPVFRPELRENKKEGFRDSEEAEMPWRRIRHGFGC